MTNENVRFWHHQLLRLKYAAMRNNLRSTQSKIKCLMMWGEL
jgi:hypothetical protein